MKIEKKHQKIENELDMIVRTELNQRVGHKQKKKDIDSINRLIESKNRQIVEVHQKGKIINILPSMISGWLQTREQGSLYLSPEETIAQNYKEYNNIKERFETLFAASLMALPDKELISIVKSRQKLFYDNFTIIRELSILGTTVKNIAKQINMTESVKPQDEETAVSYLKGIAPLKTDLQTIEARYIEVKDSDYIEEAVKKLHGEIHWAAKSLDEKNKNAAKYLFDQANQIFHNYKSTSVSLKNLEIFTAQKQDLLRYLGIFDSIGDTERKSKIEGFVSSIDKTVLNQQDELLKQKEHEARLSEKIQNEINETYDRFLEIKALYAQGNLNTKIQQKNAEARLIKYRDTLIANGHRIMARDIERFINSTGIGKKNTRSATENSDDFDYKKGFHILLPVTILLLLIVFIMIIK
ncbi:hypothetical protein QUF70_00695 [Desulfobacterales bacterium HSG17]|nr:hypothetical protein [Desulfobacterales bacterium HSG17]